MEGMEIHFTFKDEKTAQEFLDYSKRFAEDREVNQRLQQVKSEDQAYEILKEKGYINMSFQEFMNKLNEVCDKLDSACENSRNQLSIEELEGVVGGHIFQGSWWKKNWQKVVSFVPFLGGLTSSIYDAATGKTSGWDSVGKIGISVGAGLIETIGAVASGGASIGAHIAISAGSYAGSHVYERGMRAGWDVAR